MKSFIEVKFVIFESQRESISNDENMRFRPAIFIRLVHAPFCLKWDKNLSFNS